MADIYRQVLTGRMGMAKDEWAGHARVLHVVEVGDERAGGVDAEVLRNGHPPLVGVHAARPGEAGQLRSAAAIAARDRQDGMCKW